MSCPQASSAPGRAGSPLRVRPHPLRIALVGNPNVGKSVLFGRLTGSYAVVSNYPGTTVGVTQGRALIAGEVCDVIDTPGVNALEGVLSEDELVSRRILEEGRIDLVIQVADARNLRRSLMLTSHLASFRVPMVLALNMSDEAKSHGVTIDIEGLSRALGVPVIETVATEGRGLKELRASFDGAAIPTISIRREGIGVSDGHRLGHDRDHHQSHHHEGHHGHRHGHRDRTLHAREVDLDRQSDHARFAHELTHRLRRIRPRSSARFQEQLGKAMRRPFTGLLILAAVLCVVYLFVGVFGAQTLVGLIEAGIFRRYVNPAAIHVAAGIPSELVRSFLVGDYGLVTMGLTYAMAIVLPVVATFFLVFSVLEDSGYIPRLAIFSDRIFRAMGLNGKAVLPMVLGLGCDTMATMTTRILGTPKERLIAVLLLSLGVPCSAQLATILGILGGISVGALVTLFTVVLVQMFVVGFLAARVLPGDRSEFILEMPPIRVPDWRNVVHKTVLRVRWYLGEAVPLFLIGTAILFALDRTGGLAWLMQVTQPVVQGLLGLPPKASAVFIMGFLRRDYGAAGLFDMARHGELTGAQAVVALTVMTLFVPCVAHFLMTVKEQGAKVAVGILGVVTVVAVLTGTALNFGLRVLGVTF
jgi:ferrous iron transport protein B